MSQRLTKGLRGPDSVARVTISLDVVPMHFAFDGTYVYGFTTLGQKIEWMRANPLVCLEVDDESSDQQWTSIIIFGRYEELPDTPEYLTARTHAHAFLQKRALWWEPAYISQAHRAQPHSLTPIFYRIHIDSMTGHMATADVSEPVITGTTSQNSTVAEQVLTSRP